MFSRSDLERIIETGWRFITRCLFCGFFTVVFSLSKIRSRIDRQKSKLLNSKNNIPKLNSIILTCETIPITRRIARMAKKQYYATKEFKSTDVLIFFSARKQVYNIE